MRVRYVCMYLCVCCVSHVFDDDQLNSLPPTKYAHQRPMQELWRRTAASAAMGNEFVIWSEEALVLHGQAEEAEAVAQVRVRRVCNATGMGLSPGGWVDICARLLLCQQLTKTDSLNDPFSYTRRPRRWLSKRGFTWASPISYTTPATLPPLPTPPPTPPTRARTPTSSR